LIFLILFVGCVSSEIPTKSSDKTVVIGAPAHTPAGWVGFCTRNPKDPACRETFPQFFESYCKSNPQIQSAGPAMKEDAKSNEF